jgi:hypothetical protein
MGAPPRRGYTLLRTAASAARCKPGQVRNAFVPVLGALLLIALASAVLADCTQ